MKIGSYVCLFLHAICIRQSKLDRNIFPKLHILDTNESIESDKGLELETQEIEPAPSAVPVKAEKQFFSI